MNLVRRTDVERDHGAIAVGCRLLVVRLADGEHRPPSETVVDQRAELHHPLAAECTQQLVVEGKRLLEIVLPDDRVVDRARARAYALAMVKAHSLLPSRSRK